MIEAREKITARLAWAIAMVACWAALAAGQLAGAQNAGIDAALLAKANGGDAAAQVAVGDCYATGTVAARDLRQAALWYQKAAVKGDIGGELRLAALYRDGGKGFARDMAQAAAWYRTAADQGDVDAEATMGTLCSMGQGVAQDYAEAYYWLDLAASVTGPNQATYAAHRQMMGAHITVDELEAVQERAAAWKAAHPRVSRDK
jgi:TPR repeat protein